MEKNSMAEVKKVVEKEAETYRKQSH